MYPALKEYLSTKRLDPKDFPTTITSYLRVQLDNIKRYYSRVAKLNKKLIKFDARSFCDVSTNEPQQNYEPKSFCSFAVLMKNAYTQINVGKGLGSKIVTLYKDLQEKMDFFPLIIYRARYYLSQTIAPLYKDLSYLLSNENMPKKDPLFKLYTHLLTLHLAESRSRHDNILVNFIQMLNPEMKLGAREVNTTGFLQNCYKDSRKYSSKYFWNPLLSFSEVNCTGALFGNTLSKISNSPVPGQKRFTSRFYWDSFVLYAQLMYLQAFDAQKSMPNIITQILMHDQIFELPFSSIVKARKEINGQLNQILAKEMKSTDIIALNFFDIVQFMTGSLNRFMSERYDDKNVMDIVTKLVQGLANLTETAKKEIEKKSKGYVSNLFLKKLLNQDHLSMKLSTCFHRLQETMRNNELKVWKSANLCTIIMANIPECQQLCQESKVLKEIPKVGNLSRLLHNTAHPPSYTGNRKQTMTIGPIPFCLFDKQIKGALRNLSHNYAFKIAEANFGYNFCEETVQSYTDSGLCNIINIQKGSGQLNYEYNAIPSYGENQHKLHYPQTASRRTFKDGIILILDSWAFNGLVTKTHNSNSDPMDEYQLLQSEKLNNFKVLLHDHNDILMMLSQENKIIRLDKDNESVSVPSFYTKVKVEVQDADENIRTVEVKKRKCRFQDETDGLKLFLTYTKANCLYECQYQLAREKCQCVPWNFPHKSTDELCDFFGNFCFTREISWLSENLNDVSHIGSPPCGCYPSCKSYKYTPVGQDIAPKSPKWLDSHLWQNEIKQLKRKSNIVDLFNVKNHIPKQYLHHYIFAIFYGKTLTLMPQHENLGPMSFIYEERIMPHFASAKLDNFKNSSDDLSDRIKNIAILYIDFDRSRYRVRRQIKRTSLANMLSSFGGILGLFLGLSVIGLLDMAMNCIMKIFLLKNRNPRG